MAIAIAYESEHVALSQQMAQRAFASICDANGPVLSNGFSCQAQIRIVADKTQPMHLAEILYDHLDR
jgi:hypothetical protein